MEEQFSYFKEASFRQRPISVVVYCAANQTHILSQTPPVPESTSIFLLTTYKPRSLHACPISVLPKSFGRKVEIKLQIVPQDLNAESTVWLSRLRVQVAETAMWWQCAHCSAVLHSYKNSRATFQVLSPSRCFVQGPNKIRPGSLPEERDYGETYSNTPGLMFQQQMARAGSTQFNGILVASFSA